METAQRLKGISEYYFSQKLREIDAMNKAGRQVINLGIGSPDLPPHPDVIRVLQEEALKPHQHAYQSYKGSPVLRKAVAEWYRRWYGVELDPEREILPLIGSKEGIMHICMTYINPGDTVLIPNPGYPTYRSAATIAGASVMEYALSSDHDWFPDLEAISQQLQASGIRRALMFVNYPHMPTGQLPVRERFEELVAFAQQNQVLLIHDNPYSFILNDNPVSLLSVKGAKEVVIELNSLSKSHNMAGWRIGMLVADSRRVDEILQFKSNMDSGMFLPLQLAASRALELGKDWHDEVNDIYRTRRARAYELLQLLDCTCDHNQAGMFLWASVPHRYADGFALSDAILQQAAVFITPGGIFGSAGNRYIRVSLCSTEEKFNEAIERIKTRMTV